MRVVTWNLGWRFGDWEPRQPAIEAVLADTDADVVAVQETWPAQLDKLADRLGMFWSFSGRQPSGNIEHGFGNGILTRSPVRRSEEITLPALDGPAYRSALLVELAGDVPAVVATTHLAHRFNETATRTTQLAALSRFIEECAGVSSGPVLLVGDLNAVPDSDEIRRLTGRSTPYLDGTIWSDAWEQVGDGAGWTWSATNPLAAESKWPNRRLDYVLSRWPRDGTVGDPVAARLIGSEPIRGIMASDHFGVLVDVATVADC